MLSIIGTPIGNLQDVTLRAIETLKKVDIILAEDTQRTKVLLNHYGIQTYKPDVGPNRKTTSGLINRKQLISFHEHSSPQKIDWIINQLKHGKDIALVTDAGMPGVADPGGRLISTFMSKFVSPLGASKQESRIQNLEYRMGKKSRFEILDSRFIIPIPGVSALTTIMSVSGMPNEPCLFLGYLPKKKGRQTLLKQLSEASKKSRESSKSLYRTIVLFESPQRVQRTLKDLDEAIGSDKKIVVGRELTKQFEEIVWTSFGEAVTKSWPKKGEYTILVSTETYG
jgi:16S rRNA (cytidine1402-2'-O)-methyltransferase